MFIKLPTEYDLYLRKQKTGSDLKSNTTFSVKKQVVLSRSMAFIYFYRGNKQQNYKKMKINTVDVFMLFLTCKEIEYTNKKFVYFK